MDKCGIIHRHHWKERPKISKIAKFERDLLKTNEDIACQSHTILQTFVWWGVGEAQTLPPPPPPPQKTICKFSQPYGAIIFARLRRITFKFGSFTNVKALFPVMSTDFP